MIFVLERVSQPADEPVALAEMLKHLREFSSVSQETQDEVTRLIKASREWVEDYTGRALVDQQWRLTEYLNGTLSGDAVSGFAQSGSFCGQYERRNNLLKLRRSPLIGVISVHSLSSDGVATEVDPDSYEVRDAASKWPVLAPLEGAIWTNASLRVVYRAGFVNQFDSPEQELDLIPERFKQAMKLWAEAHYDRDPKDMETLLEAAKNLIKPERSEFGFA